MQEHTEAVGRSNRSVRAIQDKGLAVICQAFVVLG